VHIPARAGSVLEASRANGIPHPLALRRTRPGCSTCRIRVEGPAGAPAAAQRGRGPHARAGRRRSPTCVSPASCAPPATSPSRRSCGRRSRAPANSASSATSSILFIDLRRWTGLAEQQLPHDLVYVQELFFEAVGEAVREAAAWRTSSSATA
jgi:adenylate cyclase